MAVENQLAMISGGQTLRVELVDGGYAELTAADIRAALGFVRFDAHRFGAPAKKLGIDIVLARYCADEPARREMANTLARIAWRRFWDICPHSNAEVSKNHFYRLAQVLTDDYCVPGRYRGASDDRMAREMNLDPRTWKKNRFKRLYGGLRTDCSRWESPVMQALKRIVSGTWMADQEGPSQRAQADPIEH